MIWLALLRGINVGGKNRVEMARLRASFENQGFDDVRTYINSGNVIFRHSDVPDSKAIESAMEADFGFEIRVTLRDRRNIAAIAAALPDDWVNDASMKCDVMFLWEHLDSRRTLDELAIKRGIDEVKSVEGALVWRVDRPALTRSGMMKVARTDLYKSMTVRNCNTVRKLAAMMNELEDVG